MLQGRGHGVAFPASERASEGRLWLAGVREMLNLYRDREKGDGRARARAMSITGRAASFWAMATATMQGRHGRPSSV